MREITVKENEAGQRLDKLLGKILKEAPSSFLYKMLRKKNIVLNGKKATGSEKTAVGDVIRFFLSDETFDKFAGAQTTEILQDIPKIQLEILYETEDILVFDKPAGMLSQKAKPDDVSANEYVLQYLLNKDLIKKEDLNTFKPSVCNRLDRNTSGLLIAGKTLKGSQQMSRALKERTIQKYYLCLVKGVITKPSNIKGYLIKDEKTNRVSVSRTEMPGAKYIETEYQPLEQREDTTLLQVHLITGRSHQIRAHLASIGHPIVGDAKYGDSALNREYAKKGVKRQLLHAYRLVLEDGTEIKTNIPEDFL